nr:uncharacterized protein LOC115265669 [Aedes albopictus]
MRFVPPNLNRDYPFKLLEQQKPDAPVIPANVDDSDDESDESDFRGFETSYDDANEEPYVEDAPEGSGTSDSEQEEQAVGGDADVSVVRRSERTTKGIPPQRYSDAGRVAIHDDDEPRTFEEAIVV